MMRRFISLLLAFLILFSAATAFSEDDWLDETEEEEAVPTEETDEAAEEEIVYVHDTLYVGNPTPMDGKFFTTMWGNATTDIDVRTLVNSYYLTVWGYETGLFVHNPATVSGLTMMDGDEGQRTYLFNICTDLFYSDGTQITAWDYAFSVLFQASPIIAETGGLPTDLRYLEGYEEYYSGESPYFSGIRVLSDFMIAFTVKAEYLPYFFELYRLGFLPYPIHEIAPGCKVYDDGEGAYIGNEDLTRKEPVFTKELLMETVMDPDYGYLSHPTVGSGPYVLTSWDGVTCTFELNPWYKGDWEGNKPTIPYLHFTVADNDTMIKQLEEREFDLLNKVVRQDCIQDGLMLSMGGDGGFTYSNYPRIGQTFIIFTPDRPALQEKNVRKAINLCMDKDTIVKDYTGGFGIPMDGLIGLGQWMYSIVMGTLPYPLPEPENPTAQEKKEYEEALEAWEALSLDGLKHYNLNVEGAIALLEVNGWTLNENGEPYVRGKDKFRCKEIDGELVKMDLKLVYPEENITAESFNLLFLPNLEEAGIHVEMTPLDMKTLLRSYNDKDIEDIDMFYLGDDFNIEFDPQLFFQEGDPDAPEEDNLAWTHAHMYDMAHKMCETEPHDTLGFMQKWIEFQEHLSDYLPLIPIYSNVYFDFYTAELKNYQILKYITWGDAMVAASMGPVVHEEVITEEEEEELEDGEEEFFD